MRKPRLQRGGRVASASDTECYDDELAAVRQPDSFLLRRGTALNAPSICCTSASGPNDTVCQQFLWDGPNCVDGCENEYQCVTVVDDQKQAAYAGGIGHELTNDITDVFDNQGQLVVHNDYGEDRTLVQFDKVVKQTLGSASTDNVITLRVSRPRDRGRRRARLQRRHRVSQVGRRLQHA